MSKILISLMIAMIFFMSSCGVEDEDTGNTVDTGLIESSNGDLIFQWGTSGFDHGTSVVVGSDNSVYVAGHTSGYLDGNTSTGSSDIFITKFSKGGRKLWTRQFGSEKADNSYSLVLDSQDSLYVTGFVKGSLKNNTNAGNSDVFLTKLNFDGIEIWSRQWGTDQRDEGNSVAVGDDGTIYVTGSTWGSFDGKNNAGWEDIFLTKLSNDGKILWTKQWGGEGSEAGNSVTVANGGTVYLTGDTESDVLDGNIQIGSRDSFLTKFDNNGKKIWTVTWGLDGHLGKGFSVLINDEGYVFVAGYTKGDSVDWNEDTYLVKFNDDGEQQWFTQWGLDGDDTGKSMAFGSGGSIYVAGGTNGVVNGDGVAEGNFDILLTKLKSDGSIDWMKQPNTNGWDYSNSIAVGIDGSIFLTGNTLGSLDGFTNAGENDIFLMKIIEK